MRIAQRLYIAVIPAVLGVLLVGALAYWGQYAHTAPILVVWFAAIAAIASLVLTWRSTRYVARRVERLAATRDRGAPPDTDELDSIEHTVSALGGEVAAQRELAGLYAEIATGASRRVDDVRLPLHILLENRFGDLNENQEEMLGAARAAADEAALAFERVRVVAQLDARLITPRRDALRVDDVIAPLIAFARARGETTGLRVHVDLEPAPPRVVGDRTYLQEALFLLVSGALDCAQRDEEMGIMTRRRDGGIQIVLRQSAIAHPRTMNQVLGRRMLAALGTRVEELPGETVVTLAGTRATQSA